MVMFSSMVREDAEPDCPYYQQTGNQKCNRGCWQEPICITDEPLGGWLKPQHNPVNTRLASFREEVALHAEEPDLGLSMPHLARLWVERNELGDFVTDDEFDHSQKVLVRLGRLNQGAESWN